MPRPQPRLLLATSSADKIGEYRDIFRDLRIELLTPADLRLNLEVQETGETFRDNAVLKAGAYWRAAGVACLAEDSGFTVDALNGAPGVQSARWEGEDYRRKNLLIIERLHDLVGVQRRCRYVCETVMVEPHGQFHHARGELVGRVAERPAGSGGFGYDPIFLLPEAGRTLAELSAAEKHTLSHRGKAARALLPTIRRLLLAEAAAG